MVEITDNRTNGNYICSNLLASLSVPRHQRGDDTFTLYNGIRKMEFRWYKIMSNPLTVGFKYTGSYTEDSIVHALNCACKRPQFAWSHYYMMMIAAGFLVAFSHWTAAAAVAQLRSFCVLYYVSIGPFGTVVAILMMMVAKSPWSFQSQSQTGNRMYNG